MSRDLVHQLGGNIAKKLVKNAENVMEHANSALKSTEKWVVGMLTSSSILFWVGVSAVLVFLVWKPWEHLTFEQMEEDKEGKKDEEKDDKGLLSKENLAMMSVVGIFVALVMAAVLYVMNQ